MDARLFPPTEVTTSCTGGWRLKTRIGSLTVSTIREGQTGSCFITSLKHKSAPEHQGYEEVARVDEANEAEATLMHELVVRSVCVAKELQTQARLHRR